MARDRESLRRRPKKEGRQSAIRQRLAQRNEERAARGASGGAFFGLSKPMLILIVIGFILVAGFLYWKTRVPKGPWDVNKASIEQLETLPGIGPATAKDIVARRPYKTANDLIKVKGIGEKTVEKIRGQLVFPDTE